MPDARAPRMSANPVIPGWYADPELHLFAGRYYIYPTYSVAYNDQTFFECWSSPDLVDWRNEGVILDFADVPWSANRCAWAPSCAEKDGRYYFYFSAGDGIGIGVAVSDSPTGPFHDPLGHALVSDWPFGAQPIDAHAYVDDDGQGYLYFGGRRHCAMVRLGDDMISLEGDYLELTPEHYVEGPFMIKRRGVYYLTWSEGSWGDSTYGVAYGRADSPYGPFEREGAILASDSAVGNGAGHASILNIPGTDDWYICYHRRPVGETHHNHRVTCMDRLRFDDAGRILPVVLTHQGVEARSVR